MSIFVLKTWPSDGLSNLHPFLFVKILISHSMMDNGKLDVERSRDWKIEMLMYRRRREIRISSDEGESENESEWAGLNPDSPFTGREFWGWTTVASGYFSSFALFHLFQRSIDRSIDRSIHSSIGSGNEEMGKETKRSEREEQSRWMEVEPLSSVYMTGKFDHV
jgi:hypothetical protein